MNLSEQLCNLIFQNLREEKRNTNFYLAIKFDIYYEPHSQKFGVQ